MRTARPTRLAAALGAGVLLTGLGATPALASPAHPAGWTAEHGLPGGSFLVAGAEVRPVPPSAPSSRWTSPTSA